MDITRRCDYALRILEAAYESGDSYVSVADISEQEDIPYAFARSIQHDLVKAGFLKTIRGVRGGLTLFVAVWAMQRFGWLLTPELIDSTTLLKFFATQTPLGLLAAL